MNFIRRQELRRRGHQGVPILAFHKIGNHPACASMPWFYVSVTHFDRILTIFERKSYRSISITDAIQANTKADSRFVISFDDGYESSLKYAAPKLIEHRFVAIQFLVANRLGQRNEWDLGQDTTPERLMSETQVREWISLGFEIGAHTLTHPTLSAIPLAEARNEVAGSKKKLEDLFGVQIKHFAYPYGNFNDAVVDLVREAGFETACTCDRHAVHNGVDPFRLSRFLTDERSFSSFSSYKLSYAVDDLKTVARHVRQTARQFISRIF
jgi:peptidoglycan/xylan/chitin deacetylase (PgdA/CDA1 family)